jgi:hypothetical protein
MGDNTTCGHCNTPKPADAQDWKFEIGFWFCPDCKTSYWHNDDCAARP